MRRRSLSLSLSRPWLTFCKKRPDAKILRLIFDSGKQQISASELRAKTINNAKQEENRSYREIGAQAQTAEQTKTKHYSSPPLIHRDESGGLVGTLAFKPDGLKHREQDEATGWPRNLTEEQQKQNREKT